MADFTICSVPHSIRFECPFCEADVEIPWKDVDSPGCWQDEWPDAECPECGEMVSLGDWTYD